MHRSWIKSFWILIWGVGASNFKNKSIFCFQVNHHSFKVKHLEVVRYVSSKKKVLQFNYTHHHHHPHHRFVLTLQRRKTNANLRWNRTELKVRVKSKQWPLAAGLDTFARHSPTTFPGLDTFARHSPALSPDSIHSPDIRQPFSPDSIHLTLDTFDTFARIRQIWGEWPLLSFFLNFRRSGISFFILALSIFFNKRWVKTSVQYQNIYKRMAIQISKDQPLGVAHTDRNHFVEKQHTKDLNIKKQLVWFLLIWPLIT